MDLLATVDAFPNPDDKIRSTSLKVLNMICICLEVSVNGNDLLDSVVDYESQYSMIITSTPSLGLKYDSSYLEDC